MSILDTVQGTLVAERPRVDKDGVISGETRRIHLMTPQGNSVVAYDPNVLEVDHDIGAICTVLQSIRNLGMLREVDLTMHLDDGNITEFHLSEVQIVD